MSVVYRTETEGVNKVGEERDLHVDDQGLPGDSEPRGSSRLLRYGGAQSAQNPASSYQVNSTDRAGAQGTNEGGGKCIVFSCLLD